MEEAAIVFVADDASPPVKTAQIHLPTDHISLQLHHQLPHQQQLLVTSSLQQRQQQHLPKCDPHKRFQQQPVSPQRCHHQPQQEHQVARVPSSTEGPAVAVDRSACSSTRGGCTEARVKQDVQPEHVPAQHPTRSMASIHVRAVDENVGCADVTKRQVSDTCISHSTCPQPMTSAVQHCTITTSVHTKAPGSSTAGRNRPRPVSSRVSSQHKLKGERKNTLEAPAIISSNNARSTKTTSPQFKSDMVSTQPQPERCCDVWAVTSTNR